MSDEHDDIQDPDLQDPDVDPIDLVRRWLAEAVTSEPNDPAAANLATVDERGRSRSRMVLIRGVDQTGFRFYTNYRSDKGREIDANPWVALCVHWKTTRRQVRIEGRAARVTAADSDAYFAARPRGSQLGAWASDQSAAIESREALQARYDAVAARFDGVDVPRPEHWGGYLVVPERIELWLSQRNRLHDRLCFERSTDGWVRTRLQP